MTGIADLRIQQPFDQPKLDLTVDRTKAQQAGFSQRDVASNLLIALSGSFQTNPILAQPEERRELQRHHADAAVQDRFAAGAGEYSDHRQSERAKVRDPGQLRHGDAAVPSER